MLCHKVQRSNLFSLGEKLSAKRYIHSIIKIFNYKAIYLLIQNRNFLITGKFKITSALEFCKEKKCLNKNDVLRGLKQRALILALFSKLIFI